MYICIYIIITAHHDNCNHSSSATKVTTVTKVITQIWTLFVKVDFFLAWLLFNLWALCHLFWPLHKYRIVLMCALTLTLQPYDKDKASSMPECRMIISPKSGLWKNLGVTVNEFSFGFTLINIASFISIDTIQMKYFFSKI